MDGAGLYRGGTLLATFDTPDEARRARILALHFGRMCVIDRYGGAGNDPTRPTVTCWQ